MKLLRMFVGGVLALVLNTVAHAGFIEATVDGTDGPWGWVDQGLNSALAYGPAAQDFTAPTRIKLSDIGSGVGMNIFILYKSGLVSNFNNCCGGPWGPSGEDTSLLKDDSLGTSGEPFPSNYTPTRWGSNLVADFNANTFGDNPNGLVANASEFGVFLMSLIAALTDDNGAVVGDPFPVGAVFPFATDPGNPGNDSVGRAFGIGLSFNISAAAYPGATYLNLGVNDDLFTDNGGALRVCVASSQADMDACIRPASTAPEPGSLMLMALGALGAIALRRRRSG